MVLFKKVPYSLERCYCLHMGCIAAMAAMQLAYMVLALASQMTGFYALGNNSFVVGVLCLF